MLNLFINYDCNLECDYCFARELADSFPERIDASSFERLAAWLERSGVAFLGILGGEPTLHPLLPQMLARLKSIGVATVLFTNALYHDEGLSATLAQLTRNLVVNGNDPQSYSPAQAKLFTRNMEGLKANGARVSLSKNFSAGNTGYGYLLEYCARFGIDTIRYDVSRPSGSGLNSHFSNEQSFALAPTLLRFTQDCCAANVAAGLDCCLPSCMFNEEEAAWLRESSLRFQAVCQPSLDIQTDLSVSHCLPLWECSLADVTQYAGEWELLGAFGDMMRPLRASRPKSCEGCESFGKSCQGGCLALRAVKDRQLREMKEAYA
jgi:MoaA/NifB/PqqE/SkfB family radical SAM enzyme